VPAVPLIPRLLNVATPLTAVAVAVPTSVAPALTVAVTTVELSLVTTLLPTSCNDTCGCVVNAAPDAVPEGFRTETTLVGVEVTTSALFADSELTAPGDARVRVAAFPTRSTIDPPFSARADVDA
jgi:hypothetical protein